MPGAAERVNVVYAWTQQLLTVSHQILEQQGCFIFATCFSMRMLAAIDVIAA